MGTAKGKGTGFGAPTIGTIYPKGTTVKINPDGTGVIVPPKKKTDKKKK